MSAAWPTRRATMLALAAAATLPLGARAQSRPLAFIVPQPAGNPTDGIARKLQPLLQAALGQTVIVENVPGAGGALGVQKVLQAPADQPVLLIASQTEPILTPMALANARYTPEALRAVALVGRAAYVLAGHADLPATSLVELGALARQSTAKPLSFGHIGQGSMIHLLHEQWARKSGVTLTQVPYRGVPPVVQDLMGGQIDLTFLPMGGSTPTLIEGGKVRAYGVTTAAALPRFPRLVPLAQQDKALADFVYGTWAAVLVPRTTPEARVQALHQALAKALQDPDVRSYALGSGVEPPPEPLTLAQLEQFYQGETRLYQTLARELGVTPQ